MRSRIPLPVLHGRRLCAHLQCNSATLCCCGVSRDNFVML